AMEVGLVGEVVERGGERALRGREREVDDLVALTDRPAQTLDKLRAAALELVGEDADARQLAVGRERADDRGARGAVAGDVATFVVHEGRVPVLVDVHDDGAL